MRENFTDLDGLIEKTHSEYTKKYFIETIECYRSGAYRSAIVTLNIAVLTDIFEKITELSNDGDKKASEYVKKIDALYQERSKDKNSYDVYKEMSDVEKNIREDSFKHFEFYSEKDHKILEDIRYYRNICAHPLFYQNDRYNNFSPELTRSLIVEAANILFIHRATNGKAITDILFEVIKQKSFAEFKIEEIEEIIFSSKYLGKAKDNVIIDFTKAIFAGALDAKYETSETIKLAKVFAVLFKKKNKLVKDAIMNKLSGTKAITDKKLEKLLYLAFYSNEFFGSIKTGEKAILTSLENLVKTIELSGELCKILYKISDSHKKIKVELESRKKSDLQKLNKCNDYVSAGKTLSEIISVYGKYLTIQELQNLLETVNTNLSLVNNIYIEGYLINLFEKSKSDYYFNDEDKFKNLWGSFVKNSLKQHQKSFSKLEKEIEEFDEIPF